LQQEILNITEKLKTEYSKELLDTRNKLQEELGRTINNLADKN